MAVRNKLGEKRESATKYARGVERRKVLQKAALELLVDSRPDEISFNDICEKAAVPAASAYHYYTNKFGVFEDVAEILGDRFVQAHQEPYQVAEKDTWTDLVGLILERSVEIYRANPAAVSLLLAGRVPAAVKHSSDCRNFHKVAEIFDSILSTHFVVPTLSNKRTMWFYVLEITDLVYSLSVMESGRISSGAVEEAKRITIGYLSEYLPPILDRRAQGR